MRIVNLTEHFPDQIVKDLLNGDIVGRHWIDDVLNQRQSVTPYQKTILVLVQNKTTVDELTDALAVQYLPRGNYGFLKFLNLNNEDVDGDDKWRIQLIKEAITVLNKCAQRSGHQSCYEICSMVAEKPTSVKLENKWSKQCKSLYSAGFRLVETETSSCGVLPFETCNYFLVFKPHLLANFQFENGVKADYVKRSVASDVFKELSSVIGCKEDGQREAKELETFANVFKESTPKMTLIRIRPSFPWNGWGGPTRETQVAVIGGGVAGLAAAASLSEAGFDVVILEASNYLGGRVKQVQPFEGFAPIDLGGEFIHGSKTVINKIAEENNWIVRPAYVAGSSDGEKIYHKGKLYPVSSDEPDIKAAREAWYEIIDNGLHRKPGLDSDHAGNASTSPLSDVFKVRLEEKGLSQDVLNIVDVWKVKTSAVSFEHYGVLEGQARMESKHGWGLENFRLAESYSQLVKHLLDKCREVDKRLCWQVEEVMWKGDGSLQKGDKVGKVNSDGGVLVTSQQGEALIAKYVIITVPLTVLKDGDISFVPDLPSNKKRAIDIIQMRGALKIVCRFRERFWPQTLNLVYSVRGFVSQIWMYTRDSADSDEKCHVIAGFQTAEPAEEKVSYSGKDMLDGFLRQLDEIFGTEASPQPASDSFMDYVYYHWSKHLFVRGGYSSPTAHAYDLRQELKMPVEDRLFFAGEATSSCGTVHTAIDTGLRAAGEVCVVAGKTYNAKL